jgi:hypothetical protein
MKASTSRNSPAGGCLRPPQRPGIPTHQGSQALPESPAQRRIHTVDRASLYPSEE